MRAITVHQPYAELIASGAKRVENRKWATRYRGTLWIHAGKSADWLRPGERLEDFATSALVARVELVDVVEYAHIVDNRLRGRYPWITTDPHAIGPYCWILEDPERILPPLPMLGRQGLFPLPADAIGELKARGVALWR